MGGIQQEEETVPGALTPEMRHEIGAIVTNLRANADALEECNTVAEVRAVMQNAESVVAGISDSGLHDAIMALEPAPDQGEGAESM